MAAALPDFVRPVAEVTEGQGLYILVYGPAGAGKTTLATTTPDPSRTLVLSAEGGTLSIRDSSVLCSQINSMNDIKSVLRWLMKEPDALDWVVLDSVSEIAEVVLAEEMTRNKDGRAAYGEMTRRMVAMLKTFRDMPINVLVISAARVKEDEGRLTLAPSTPGNKLADRLPYLFDEVLYLAVSKGEGGEIKRALLTQPDGKREAKDRSGKLDRWERPNLAAIARKIHAPKAGNDDGDGDNNS